MLRIPASLPLSRIQVSEDLGHYTRGPDRPLRYRRLMVVVADKHPPSSTDEKAGDVWLCHRGAPMKKG